MLAQASFSVGHSHTAHARWNTFNYTTCVRLPVLQQGSNTTFHKHLCPFEFQRIQRRRCVILKKGGQQFRRSSCFWIKALFFGPFQEYLRQAKAVSKVRLTMAACFQQRPDWSFLFECVLLLLLMCEHQISSVLRAEFVAQSLKKTCARSPKAGSLMHRFAQLSVFSRCAATRCLP